MAFLGIRWKNPLRDIAGLGLGFATGGWGGLLQGGLGMMAAGGSPGMGQAAGFSPEEQEQMRRELMQQMGQQREQALASLQERATRQGMAGTPQMMLAQSQTGAGYTDALSSGLADIMAQSAEAKRRDWLQRKALQLQGQAQYTQLLSGLGKGWGAQGQQAARPYVSPYPAYKPAPALNLQYNRPTGFYGQ